MCLIFSRGEFFRKCRGSFVEKVRTNIRLTCTPRCTRARFSNLVNIIVFYDLAVSSRKIGRQRLGENKSRRHTYFFLLKNDNTISTPTYIFMYTGYRRNHTRRIFFRLRLINRLSRYFARIITVDTDGYRTRPSEHYTTAGGKKSNK